MSDTRGFPLIPVLLSISLLVNLVSWSNTRHLRAEVSRLHAETSNLRSYWPRNSSVPGRPYSAYKEERAVVNPADVEVTRVEENRAEVKLSWQVKEYNQASMDRLKPQQGLLRRAYPCLYLLAYSLNRIIESIDVA
jgi:hypothetical protein